MDEIIQEQNPTQSSFPRFLPWIAGGISVVLLVLLVILVLSLTKKTHAADITGTIAYTALSPDPEDRGEVRIKYRKYNSSDAYTTVYTTTPYSTSPWIWKEAVSGQPYEIIADLVVDGTLVTTSEPLTVTAPAYDQTLSLRVTWHDLPKSTVEEQVTYIKGDIAVNGYIPPNSTILVQVKSKTDTDFQTVATIPNANQKNSWIWNKAVPLNDYIVKAVLMDGKTQLADTQTILATGGDAAINFTLNSTAVLPTQPEPTPVPSSNSSVTPSIKNTPSGPTTGMISGIVSINGPMQEKTSLLMLWRKPGDKDYQVITRIQNPSHNGQAWSWDNQPIGKHYEVTAVLQVNEQNVASAQSQQVTVPAKNINFTLNSGVIIPTPEGKVTVNSCTSIGNNQYNAVISFPRTGNASNYWIQVGRGNAASDVYNSKIQGISNNPQITVQIDGNRSYYAQYAYSFCTTCNDNANFSNFSPSASFSCGGGSTYTGYVCNLGNYTCQLTTDNNPPYAFNNNGLSLCQQQCRPTPTQTPTSTPLPPTPTVTPEPAGCNQTCGSNGRLCSSDLTCVSGEMPGSNVCRNPDCTDIESCNCLPQ